MLISVACLTIAPTLGVLIATFSIVDGLLFRPLPFRSVDKLVMLREFNRSSLEAYGTISIADVAALRSGIFSQLTTYEPTRRREVVTGTAHLDVPIATVEATFCETVWCDMAAGRPLSASDADESVAIVSQHFSSDISGRPEGALGTHLTLNGRSIEIVGITSQGFIYPMFGRSEQPDVLLATRTEGITTGQRTFAIGRIPDGISLDAAQSRISSTILAAHRATGEPSALGVQAVDVGTALFGSYRPFLWVLLCGCALLATAAGLSFALVMLSRAQSTVPTYVTKIALGATTSDLCAECVVQVVLLAGIATLTSVAVAWLSFASLLAILPSQIYRVMSAGINIRSIVIAGAFAVVIAALASFGPWLVVLNSRRRTINPAQTLPLPRGALFVLIGGQAAAATVLIAAGVAFWSHSRTREMSALDIHPGPGAMVVSVLRKAQAGGESVLDSYSAALTELRMWPSVTSAALATGLPLTDLAPDATLDQPAFGLRPDVFHCTSGYFDALGVNLLLGRDFSRSEDSIRTAATVAIVNQAVWVASGRGSGIIGSSISLGEHAVTVIGVVADFRSSFDAAARPAIFLPFGNAEGMRPLLIARLKERVRAPELPSLGAQVSRVIGKPVNIVPFADMLATHIAYERFQTIVYAFLGLSTLAIALAATFGACRCSIELRRQELAIRIAVGSSPHAACYAAMKNEMLASALGIAVGAIAYMCSTRLLEASSPGIHSFQWHGLVASLVVVTGCGTAVVRNVVLRVSGVALMGCLKGE